MDVRPDEMQIPITPLNAQEIAQWWAGQGSNVQAEFLRMMMVQLEKSCGDAGKKCMQLAYIADELDFDTKYDLHALLGSERGF